MVSLSANARLCCALIVILLTSGCMTNAENRSNYILEKMNASQEYYDDLVTSDPGNATAWCIRGMYYLDCNGQDAEAMESCNRALELDPESGIAWFLKGVILVNTYKRDEALLCFENATKYDPGLTKDVLFVTGNM